eukprot:scaffold34935_cov189-Amphora_coffeaeformis.AAC.2
MYVLHKLYYTPTIELLLGSHALVEDKGVVPRLLVTHTSRHSVLVVGCPPVVETVHSLQRDSGAKANSKMKESPKKRFLVSSLSFSSPLTLSLGKETGATAMKVCTWSNLPSMLNSAETDTTSFASL